MRRFMTEPLFSRGDAFFLLLGAHLIGEDEWVIGLGVMIIGVVLMSLLEK